MLRQRLLLAVALVPAALLAADDGRLPPQTFVAKRGDASITLADVDAAVAEMPPDVRAGFFNNRNRIEATLSKRLLIDQLAAEARKEGLDQDVQTQALMKLVSNRVLAAARLRQIGMAAPKVNAEALAKEAYLADPAKFKEPDLVTTRHVLIRSGAGFRDEFAARTLAEKVRDEALAGKKFEDLAKEYSEDDGTKASGGLLPEFGPNKMQKSFEEAAFALTKAGAISPVIRTSFGFHVIQLVERKKGKQPTFDEVKPRLVEKLMREQFERAKSEHVDQLQSMATDTGPEAIDSLLTRYAAEPADASATDKAIETAPPAADAKK